MKTYKNNGGQHVMLDGTVVGNGETITCEDDLAAKYPTKFVVVVDTGTVTQTTSTPEAEKTDVQKAAEAGAVDVGSQDAEPEIPEDMKDVTDEFPAAEEAELIVCKNKRGWWIFDGDDEPANEKPLKKREVNAFVKDYLGD